MPGPPPAALVLYLVALAGQRVLELVISARHTRELAPRGVREFGRGHFPMFVVLHTLYPVALVCEVLGLHTLGGPAWRAWLVAWVAAQGLRVWCMRSLGVFWNARIQVVPGARPVRRGPYRFIPHPNYLAVAVEFVAGPMMFGAWRTALAFSLLNLVAMAVRIPEEERALKWAAQQPGSPTES